MSACYRVTLLWVRTGTHQQPDGSNDAHILRHHSSACMTLTSGQGAVQERKCSILFAKQTVGKAGGLIVFIAKMFFFFFAF